MSASILWKWWCLKCWSPILIYVLIDNSFWPYAIASEFFIPALNECIKQCNGGNSIRIHCFREVCLSRFGCYTYYTHPMSRGRKLLCSKHHVTGYVQLERVVVPEFRNMSLFFCE